MPFFSFQLNSVSTTDQNYLFCGSIKFIDSRLYESLLFLYCSDVSSTGVSRVVTEPTVEIRVRKTASAFTSMLPRKSIYLHLCHVVPQTLCSTCSVEKNIIKHELDSYNVNSTLLFPYLYEQNCSEIRYIYFNYQLLFWCVINVTYLIHPIHDWVI